jgi:hypothetical protein
MGYPKKINLVHSITLSSLALVLGAGLGLADTPQPPQSQPAAEHPVNSAQPGEPRKRVLSPGEMTNEASQMRQKMGETLRHVVQLQEASRRHKDVLKLNCVNDKLLQLKQLLNIADTAYTNMQEAIARSDQEGRYFEFGRVTIAQQQVQALSTEAENCIGEDVVFLGPTQVTVVEPNQPDDPTVDQAPEFPVVEPLPVASPKM